MQIEQLTRKDIAALPPDKLKKLALQAKRGLLDALDNGDYPEAVMKRYFWILDEHNRRRRRHLKELNAEEERIQALPDGKEKTQAIKKIMRQIRTM